MAYRYEYANVQDGEKIAELLENVDFKGEVSLAYCRRPNAVLSLEQDGDKSAFVIARDKDGEIVGCGACVINGNTAYLTGMRANKWANIPKSYELLREFCKKNGVTLTYTTILQDNISVQKMLEKQRPSMPNYLRYGECVINIIRKKLKVKDKNILTQDGWFYVLKSQSGEELARGRAVEQWDYKQYVVKHYGWKMRLAKRFFKWIPNENEVLKFFSLCNVKANDNGALDSFLRHISHLPLQGAFFLYGGECCPVKSIKYKSIIYIVDWDKTMSDTSGIELDFEIDKL
ncbi:MAG: hypothetical protein FWB75_09770 [Oscillospiraceae bacterium]|nr:hypothetical protein [Oscillospiraceae bacterium]